MPKPHLVTAGRTVVTRGFSRGRYGLLLGVAALAIGLFVLWSLNIGHGIYALIVLVVSALALTFVGGPERLARTITVADEGLRIARFHRISSHVEWSELDHVSAGLDTDRRGRPRAVLLLEPADPEVFFVRHRELRAGRRGDVAVVPAGRDERTVTELTEALEQR